jgi:Complex I intermediate-associated protein 30 (CIA30)
MTQQDPPQTRSQWDLERFVKTLSYFGAIPFLSSVDWFQQWLGSRPDPKVDASAIASQSKVILLLGRIALISASSWQELLQTFTQQGFRVRSLVPNVAQAREEVGTAIANSVEWIEADAANPNPLTADVLTADVLQDVVAVVLPVVPEMNLVAMGEAIARNAAPRSKAIFDFTHSTDDVREIWGALDDVVMGGVSQSALRLAEGGASFSGTVSTANSGGFASVRTRNFSPPLNLAELTGIELRVKGDGNRYKFMCRSEERWDGTAYCYSFDTTADQWITVRIPFTNMIPVIRAKTVAGIGALDASRITSMQLMLSKFEYDGALNPHFSPGLFQIQVESIRAYGEGMPTLILVNEAPLPEDLTEERFQQVTIPYRVVRPDVKAIAQQLLTL